MIALPWKKLCANFILPCRANHYGFFLRCPTSFYNRPIHFVSGLESLTLKALKDAEDCADILKDLGRIKYTIAHGSEQEARALDYELQQKYPAIDAMLQAADNLQATRIPLCFTTVKSGSSAKSNLQQDYWGIICDAAIKKGIKKRMEDCIDHIEYS